MTTFTQFYRRDSDEAEPDENSFIESEEIEKEPTVVCSVEQQELYETIDIIRDYSDELYGLSDEEWIGLD